MMRRFSRRAFTRSAAVLAAQATGTARATTARWGYPIGWPGEIPGNGFRIGHGFATQNTWFYPDGWHTGEDYYALSGDTAGADIYAMADGEIVYAGFDYPGRVVIVRHAADLFSMYGHLDPALAATSGPVAQGQRLGTVLDRDDGRAPSHLHLEVRRFLTTPEVNGASPRYAFNCGTECPPGPGYWPIAAPEHPVAMGWLNPSHVLLRRAFGEVGPGSGAEVMAAEGVPEMKPAFAAPDDPERVGEVRLAPGDRLALVDLDVGAVDVAETSAEAYRAWFRVVAPGFDAPVWVRALRPSDEETGADGRPSAVRIDLLPVPGSS